MDNDVRRMCLLGASSLCIYPICSYLGCYLSVPRLFFRMPSVLSKVCVLRRVTLAEVNFGCDNAAWNREFPTSKRAQASQCGDV